MIKDDNHLPDDDASEDEKSYAWIVNREGYRLDAHVMEYTQVLALHLYAKDSAADLIVTTEGGGTNSTIAVHEKREIRIPIAEGPIAISADALRSLLGPKDAGALIATVLAGYKIVPEEDYNGNWRHLGTLSDTAAEALEQLEDRMESAAEELADPDVPLFDPIEYVQDLDDEEIELLKAADSYEKIKELSKQMKRRPDVFIIGPLASCLAHVREDLMKKPK